MSEKRFSTRRFVSVMTFCTFLITGVSGLILLFLEEHGATGRIMVNWKGMHEISCIFLAIFGVWHIILNFKVLCAYFKGRDRQFVFRMDWVIPVVLALLFFISVSLVPVKNHGPRGYNSDTYYKRPMRHGH